MPPETQLKVGIAGCGVIADAHLPYIRAAGAEIVGVADLSLAAVNDLADRHQIQRVYDGIGALLDAEAPDVVHVLTPPHTHARVAIEALERGVHVLVEKPMATDPAEADSMVEAARRGGAMLAVDHNRLFDPVMLDARRVLGSGEMGELVAVESYQSGAASERTWLDDLTGGGLGDLIPHPLYLLLAFTGPASEVTAQASGTRGGPAGQLDEIRALVRGERAVGTLVVTTSARHHFNLLRLCGTKMTLEVNLNTMTMLKRREYSAPKAIGKSLPSLDDATQLVLQTVRNTTRFLTGRLRYYPGMGNLIASYYDAIRSGSAVPASGAEGAEVVRVTSRLWDAVSTPARLHEAG